MKFKCLGNLDLIGHGCHSCTIKTDGAAMPNRCVFCHGPDRVTWILIEEIL